MEGERVGDLGDGGGGLGGGGAGVVGWEGVEGDGRWKVWRSRGGGGSGV